eukprot:1811813-Pleurochrysis_carterae.AAC.1
MGDHIGSARHREWRDEGGSKSRVRMKENEDLRVRHFARAHGPEMRGDGISNADDGAPRKARRRQVKGQIGKLSCSATRCEPHAGCCGGLK